ncbi:hypothetical protein [Chamaesiphon minutus]|uniref:Uncharacterized protein n=1 Tax=Chamaesiphon minutus (strain ATCC 27169 / PCC 6605) TaxID=1173020 RepID=K9U8K6_CHAP6|nr:hypothetical protein [Chamaesiphon minutus]AFY91407.1 hypothetical protein Cha6605_0100 [Chamaesiphon minutus PCC 6605]
MSKSLPLLLLGSVSSLLLSEIAIAQTPDLSVSNAKVPKPATVSTKIPNVAGTWKVSLGEEGRTATYVFSQKGNELTGTMKGLPFGDMPIAGTIANDGKVSFAGKMRGIKFSFAGTLAGQTIKGTADLPIGRKNWTASR